MVNDGSLIHKIKCW